MTTEQLIDGMVNAIYEEFGEEYPIRTENNEQGFHEPCFYVRCVTPAKNLYFWKRSMLVSMETYEITEDHDEYGLDCGVSINLKQYRAYGTRNVRIANAKAAAEKKRAAAAGNKPAETQYTVKDGDNLITISQKYYNDANAWRDVYNANVKTIGSNPNRIYPGQVLSLPEKKVKDAG